jgi:hypothetical protein
MIFGGKLFFSGKPEVQNKKVQTKLNTVKKVPARQNGRVTLWGIKCDICFHDIYAPKSAIVSAYK